MFLLHQTSNSHQKQLIHPFKIIIQPWSHNSHREESPPYLKLMVSSWSLLLHESNAINGMKFGSVNHKNLKLEDSAMEEMKNGVGSGSSKKKRKWGERKKLSIYSFSYFSKPNDQIAINFQLNSLLVLPSPPRQPTHLPHQIWVAPTCLVLRAIYPVSALESFPRPLPSNFLNIGKLYIKTLRITSWSLFWY